MTQDSTGLKQRCGVIGMGMIGAGVAACLVRKGREVSGYDIRPEAVTQIAGVKLANSPAEVARNADVVILSVVNADQARSVMFGAGGIVEGAHSGLVVALMSTIRVPIVRELAQEAVEKGFKMIDVAITTGGAPTSDGTSGLMAGGDDETIESVRGVMADFSAVFSHMGPLGAGMAAKVARNIMHYGAARGAYEGGMLAEAAGVDLKALVDVIRKSDPHNIMSTIFIERHGVKPHDENTPTEVTKMLKGAAVLLYKDLDAGIDLAESLGVEVPGAKLSLELGDQTYGFPLGTTPHVHAQALNPDSKLRGLEMMDAVYGKGMVQLPPPDADLPPFIEATMSIMFGTLWSRPGLSMRDRRLLVIGATGQMSRPELIEIQVLGALINKEMTEEQLHEAVLQLAFYCGWGKGTSVHQGVTGAIKKYKEIQQKKQEAK